MGSGLKGSMEVYTGLWGVYSVSLGFRCFVIRFLRFSSIGCSQVESLNQVLGLLPFVRLSLDVCVLKAPVPAAPTPKQGRVLKSQLRVQLRAECKGPPLPF